MYLIFKQVAHFPALQNAVYFIMLAFFSCIIRILHTGCAKIEMPNSGAKRLILIFFRPAVNRGY
jgi:hypothetical protein